MTSRQAMLIIASIMLDTSMDNDNKLRAIESTLSEQDITFKNIIQGREQQCNDK
jgi:hypothetical protein